MVLPKLKSSHEARSKVAGKSEKILAYVIDICDLRHPNDFWDERRNARLCKKQPGGHRILYLESLGWAGGEFGEDQAIDGMSVLYSMKSSDGIEILDDFQWSDWDLNGQLIVATRSGKLQTIRLESTHPQVVFEVDLSLMEPNPTPAPSWAQTW